LGQVDAENQLIAHYRFIPHTKVYIADFTSEVHLVPPDYPTLDNK